MVELKQGDTARVLTDTLLLGGAAIDLTGAAVALLLKNEDTGALIRQTATIMFPDDQADLTKRGRVQYQPTNSDVAKPGKYDLEWEITFSDDSMLTVPTHGYGKLKINPDLG